MNATINPIVFRSKRVVLLRADFVDICDGNGCAAAILSQHMYQHSSLMNEAEQRQTGSSQNSDGLWVYKHHSEVMGELFHQYTERAIRAAYALLIEKGFLSFRPDPRFRRDKAGEYLFEVGAVQAAIDGLPSARTTVAAGPKTMSTSGF